MKKISNKENKEIEKDVEKKDAKVYEIGYLLVPSLAEEELQGEVSNIMSMIEKSDGVFLSGDGPFLKDLFYTMSKDMSDKRHKFNTAYFGWVKFEMEADRLAELKKGLDLYQNILRYLLISTVRENVAVSKKFSFVQSEEKVEDKKEEKKGVAEETVEAPAKKGRKKKEELSEDIDQKIDDLVVAE